MRLRPGEPAHCVMPAASRQEKNHESQRSAEHRAVCRRQAVSMTGPTLHSVAAELGGTRAYENPYAVFLRSWKGRAIDRQHDMSMATTDACADCTDWQHVRAAKELAPGAWRYSRGDSSSETNKG